jgi:hypothetical protein
MATTGFEGGLTPKTGNEGTSSAQPGHEPGVTRTNDVYSDVYSDSYTGGVQEADTGNNMSIGNEGGAVLKTGFES